MYIEQGNKSILNLNKVAFLCSRTVSSVAVMRCYDWAMQVDVAHTAIVSGFQSKIEKDVLHLLSKRNANVILVLARRMYKTLPAEFQSLMAAGRLLVISTTSATRNAKETVVKRNEYIAQTADKLVFGFIGKGSALEALATTYAVKSTILCN